LFGLFLDFVLLIKSLFRPALRTVLHINNSEDDDNDSNLNKRKTTSDSTDLDLQNKKKKALNLKDKTIKKSVPKVRKSGKKSKSNESDELCSMKEKCLKPNGKQTII
jgi:hypothetical protein